MQGIRGLPVLRNDSIDSQLKLQKWVNEEAKKVI